MALITIDLNYKKLLCARMLACEGMYVCVCVHIYVTVL